MNILLKLATVQLVQNIWGGEESQIPNIHCGEVILSSDTHQMTGGKVQSKFNVMLSIAVLITVFAFYFDIRQHL